jgi:hypothetical protein
VLARAELKLHDIDVIELNEAFDVKALAVIRRAGLDVSRQREWRRHRARASAGMHGREADGNDSARDGTVRGTLQKGHDVGGAADREQPGSSNGCRKVAGCSYASACQRSPRPGTFYDFGARRVLSVSTLCANPSWRCAVCA